MTNEEALEKIKLAKSEVEWEYPIDYAAAFDEAIAALERQIPMKPLKFEFESVDEELLHLICPNCAFDFYISGIQSVKEHKYCPHCGQRLEWEE